MPASFNDTLAETLYLRLDHFLVHCKGKIRKMRGHRISTDGVEVVVLACHPWTIGHLDNIGVEQSQTDTPNLHSREDISVQDTKSPRPTLTAVITEFISSLEAVLTF